MSVSEEKIQMFYTATTDSVLTSKMTCWGGNAFEQDKNRLDKNSNKAVRGVKRREQEGTVRAQVNYHHLRTNKI